MDSAAYIALEDRVGAHNYHPLPVVIAHGEGAWVTDVDGKRYLDLLAAYSALNFGHCHPQLVTALQSQLHRLTLTSRAFHNDQLGPFLQSLAELVGQDRVLPMNTGVEGVESALKLARAWGYRVKGVPHDEAVVVVCEGNFHGRTTTVISFSTDPDARADFGPYTPGFVTVPYGDVVALAAAMADPNVVGFLVEPIQGEAGVVIPPDGYLRTARELCDANNALLIADEVQSGLGRAGTTLAVDHEQVRPDLLILGKALGGGLLPVSAVAGRDDVIGVLRPGEHGSTFGGNPLAAAVGAEVVNLLRTGELQQRSAELGRHALQRLQREAPAVVTEVRGRGLWLGVELAAGHSARAVCEELMARGVLAKDTHEHTIRLAPPLVIDEADLNLAIDTLLAVLTE
jgi:ornithine--oxo-acid transaminase